MRTLITIPEWLDHLIYDDLGARYCRSNSDMVVIEWNNEELLNYLGTYFPRSYTEAYCIAERFLAANPSAFNGKTEISLFDFGSGTGGEILGFLDAICKYCNRVERIRVKALDGNQTALRLLEKVLTRYQEQIGIHIDLRTVPIVVEDIYDLSIYDSILTESYDVVISFKTICEFVTKQRLDRNPYSNFIRTFYNKLNNGGIIVLEDITSRNSVSQEWIPNMMDEAVHSYNIVDRNEGHNIQFMVNHSHQINDISKVAWRIIAK